MPPTQDDQRRRMLERLEKLVAEGTPERDAERKKTTTRCGHVKRKLLKNEPLTGELLEFAIATVGGNSDLAEKLKAGQPLNGYELHQMIDMYLLHARLAA